jgi:hypothetical protein
VLNAIEANRSFVIAYLSTLKSPVEQEYRHCALVVMVSRGHGGSPMSSSPHDALFKAVFSDPEHARGALRAVVPAVVAETIQSGPTCCAR